MPNNDAQLVRQLPTASIWTNINEPLLFPLTLIDAQPDHPLSLFFLQRNACEVLRIDNIKHLVPLYVIEKYILIRYYHYNIIT